MKKLPSNPYLITVFVNSPFAISSLTSNPQENKKAIEAAGAKAVIESIDDAGFLTSTFTGADIIYLLEAYKSMQQVQS